MGKSKHPPNVNHALKDINSANKSVNKNNAALNGFSRACLSAQKTAKSTMTSFDTQLTLLQQINGRYVEKAVEIRDLENEQEQAKGDKKKGADLKKKVARADKEADAFQKQYNLTVKLLATLSERMRSEMSSLVAAAEKFSGIGSR